MQKKNEFETVLKETIGAYSDCNSESKTKRSTDFRASFPVSSEQYIQIMKRSCPDGYNAFDDIAAQNVAALFGDKAKYTIAREGSVCVYIKANAHTCFNRSVMMSELKADEISFEGKNTFRIWWD